jgi:hypothetical protein
MGYKSTGLLDSVGTVYDQTRTTLGGRMSQKTINGIPSIGASLPGFADVFSDTGLAPVGAAYISKNVNANIARAFIALPPVAGNFQIAMYNHNILTGQSAYVGRLTIASPAILATTVIKGLEVQDVGTTNWKIWVTTTQTVLINGGLTLVNKVDLVDFTPLGSVTIPVATGNDQKANYLLQDPNFIGVNQLNIASNGIIVDSTGNKVYVHNGVSATHQYYVYDSAIAPTFLESTISGTNANPGVFTLTAHGFLNNDPVLFKTSGSYSGLVSNTVYFARNVTANTFELSATSGGISINTTGTQAGVHTIGRAFGTTGSNFVHKTGNLNVLLGTLMSNNYETLATPQHASYGGLVGFDCAAFGTSTNLYMGRLSELTSGATTWPSLTTANILGSVNEVVAPVLVAVQYSNVMDMFVYITNTSIYYGKRLVNNAIEFKGGRINTDYYETFANLPGTVRFGTLAIVGFTIANGIAAIMCSTIGQRGMISLDMSADSRFDRDYFITKVLNSPNAILKALSFYDAVESVSNKPTVFYRLSGFGTATGGWLPYTPGIDISILDKIQFKVASKVVSFLSQTSNQIAAMSIATEAVEEIVDNWEYSHDSSSNLSPTRVAFRLRYVYESGTVPTTLRFRAHDLSGTLLINQSITTDPARFEYSTNNGTSWLPLGTIPNTAGTLVRYTFISPPGVDIRPSLRNS